MTDGVPENFFILMQKGIESPPLQPKGIWMVSHTPKCRFFTISTQIRPEGEEWLRAGVHHQLKLADHAKSICRFMEIMADIPTQYSGMQDLYGRGISLVHRTQSEDSMDSQLSRDKAPESKSLPTEAQKVLFDEAVAIVEKWCATGGPK